jgi:copper homeostasis protein
VLSSGGAPTAREGAERLAAMVRQAGEALTVVAGGRVRADHAATLVAETGVRELHAHLGPDQAQVAALVAAVAG